MFADKPSAPNDSGAARAARGGNDALLGIHSQIAERLRAFYDRIQDEAIPQKFLILLEQLDKAEQDRLFIEAETGQEAAGEAAPAAAVSYNKARSSHD